MSRFFRIVWVSQFLVAVVLAADPVIDLRLVRADHKTAGSLQDAVKEGTMSDSQIEERMDAMVKGRTLIELARFTKKFDPPGTVLNFEKDREDIKVADGEIMPGGILIEVEPNVGDSGLVNLRLAFERSVDEARNRIGTERAMTSATIGSDHWEILSYWGDDKQSTMLLARFSDVTPGPRDRMAGRLAELSYQSELRWCEASDLEKFKKSTPATRSKAVAWLLGQSRLIATGGIRTQSGRRSGYENILQLIHDDNGWETKNLGWSFDIESTIGPHGKLVDLQLKSEWHPRDARKPPASPDYSFEAGTTTESGTTLVIEPKGRAASGPVAVIFITPTIHVTVASEKPAHRAPPPPEGGIGTVMYPVHPSLMRKLAEVTRPNAMPGMMDRPILKNLLEDLGMRFPAGTVVTFDSALCQVVLSHDHEGHQRFKEILEKNELTMSQE